MPSCLAQGARRLPSIVSSAQTMRAWAADHSAAWFQHIMTARVTEGASHLPLITATNQCSSGALPQLIACAQHINQSGDVSTPEPYSCKAPQEALAFAEYPLCQRHSRPRCIERTHPRDRS